MHGIFIHHHFSAFVGYHNRCIVGNTANRIYDTLSMPKLYKALASGRAIGTPDNLGPECRLLISPHSPRKFTGFQTFIPTADRPDDH